MPQTDSDKLNAFVQKMHDQGADGFAAGPWTIGADRTASGPTRRGKPASHSRNRPISHHGRTRIEQILNGLALLSIVAMMVGIAGILLTEDPGQPLVAAHGTSAIQPLHQLDDRQLREIKQKLLLTTNRLDSLAAEFRRLKRRTVSATAIDEQRLQTLENRVLLTVTRLDKLSTEILELKSTSDAILATTVAAPPAAAPPEERVPAGNRAQAIPSAQASPPAVTSTRGLVQRTHEPGPAPKDVASPAPESMPIVTTSPATDPVQKTAAAKPPAPKPVQETVVVKVPVPAPVQETAAAKPPVPVPVQETAAAQPPVPAPVQETAAAKPPVSAPVQETVAAKPPVPEPVPATVAVKRPATAPARSSGTAGDWVVNLVSYSRQKTADRYLEELKRRGITAERVVAQVNGRTMHRVRIAGFETRATASARAGVLKQELELPSIWVAKR